MAPPRRRWLVLVAAVALAASLVVGTGAVSSTSVERGVSATVAPDDQAYLGISQHAVGNGSTGVVQFTLTNRFGPGVVVDCVVVAGGVAVARVTLRSGESRRVTIHGACGESVYVNATGRTVGVNASRTVAC